MSMNRDWIGGATAALALTALAIAAASPPPLGTPARAALGEAPSSAEVSIVRPTGRLAAR